MLYHWKKALVLIGCLPLLTAATLRAQARPRGAVPPTRLGSSWITPYLGIGFEGSYYDGVVLYSDGGTDALTIDPGTSLVLGVQVGHRFRPQWSFLGNLAYASPGATFVRNGVPEGGNHFTETQLEGSVLYDVGRVPVSGKVAPFQIGGGLSLMFHSLGPFSWTGGVIDASTTAIGVHGLAALNIPLTPRADLHTQAKLALLRPSLGELEDQLARAEGVAAASLDGNAITQLVLSAGVRLRF